MSFRAGTSVRTDEDPALAARKLDWIREAGLHLMGHATYQEMAGFWPASDGEYAKPMNDINARAYADGAVRHVYRPGEQNVTSG